MLKTCTQRLRVFACCAILDPGQHACGQWPRRQREAMTETHCIQFLAPARLQGLPMPEQPLAAGHFHHQRATPEHRHLRAETISPGREQIELAGFLARVVDQHAQLPDQCLCGSQ